MSIKLNHTIVPAKDKEAAAKLFAKIFGLNYDGPMGHFAPVRVNDELTMDFDNAESFEPHHYAFHVSDDEFDAIFDRIQKAGIDWGSGPRSSRDRQLNSRTAGPGVYFHVLDGHLLELLTRP
jgi:catechol 2,3-dioxygenase-like lactoylglutathione lyase family enzyme